MAPQGSRARFQSAGRGSWDALVMEAVANQLASNFQFGSGGKGRRGELFQAKGKGPITTGPFRKQTESQDDWPCRCGLTVWARKDFCPKCGDPRAEGDW
eukprot:2556428-Heterocapsa_arctica.AAC.1